MHTYCRQNVTGLDSDAAWKMLVPVQLFFFGKIRILIEALLPRQSHLDLLPQEIMPEYYTLTFYLL